MRSCGYLLLFAFSSITSTTEGNGNERNATFPNGSAMVASSKENLFYRALKTVALRTTTLTGNCEDSPDCKEVFAGPKCDAYGRCIFPNGVKESLKKRVMAAPLAGTMSSTEESERKTMETNTKKQSPRNNYILSAASAAGVPPDSVCFSDSDCAGYPLSYCDGICRCVRGSLNAGSTCISPGLQNSRTCPTGQAYISEAGACMTVQLPGEPCQYSQQCAAAEPGAFCSRLRCECTYGMKQSGAGCVFIDSECNERGLVFIPEIGECRAVLRPGSQGCSHNLQCSQAFPDARCIQHVCTCPSELPAAVDGTCAPRCAAGEVYSGITGQCLPTVNPSGECLYTPQCQTIELGMTCENTTCRCPNGMVFSGSQCTYSCPIAYVVDSRGICVPGCQGNQIEVGGECLNQAGVGQPCRVQAQCTGGASCLRGLCVCPQSMISNGSICVYGNH